MDSTRPCRTLPLIEGACAPVDLLVRSNFTMSGYAEGLGGFLCGAVLLYGSPIHLFQGRGQILRTFYEMPESENGSQPNN